MSFLFRVDILFGFVRLLIVDEKKMERMSLELLSRNFPGSIAKKLLFSNTNGNVAVRAKKSITLADISKAAVVVIDLGGTFVPTGPDSYFLILERSRLKAL